MNMSASQPAPLSAPVTHLSRTAGGRTLPQFLRDNASDFANRPALRSKRAGLWHSLSWAQLFAKVGQTAAALQELGLKPGAVMALISENREETWIAQLAANCLGGIAVNIYPDASSDEVAYVLGHSGASIVLAEDQEQVDKILGRRADYPALAHIVYIDPRGLWTYGDAGLIELAQIQNAAPAMSDLDARISAARQDDVAVYCYTSGTTGKPKAAMLSHAFILDNAYRLMGALNIQPGSNYLSYISPAWAAEQFFGVALPLLAPLVLHFAEKPETVQKDLREIGPEFLMFTPRQWEMQASAVEARILDASRWRQRLYHWGLQQGEARAAGRGGWLDRMLLWPLADQLVLRGIRDLLGLTRAQAVLSGGSGLSADVFGRFRAFGVPLGNLYGCTELGLIATHATESRRPDTMGGLMPSDPTIAPPMQAWKDEAGQLLLKVKAFSGYLDNPAATAEMGDAETGFETGDAVRIDEEGQLIFLDRVKDLRRLATGHVYPPQFLENQLRADPMIREVIVIGDESRDRVVALINIDLEIAGRFAERMGLAFGTFSELSQLAQVRAEIAQAVRRVNANVDPGARIAAFANLPKELDADEEELTRSRKLRRGAIEAKYAMLIDGLYANAASVLCEIEITYQDGRRGHLKTQVHMNPVQESQT